MMKYFIEINPMPIEKARHIMRAEEHASIKNAVFFLDQFLVASSRRMKEKKNSK